MNLPLEMNMNNYLGPTMDPPMICQPIKKKPIVHKPDLLEEITTLANSIKERLYKIDNILK